MSSTSQASSDGRELEQPHLPRLLKQGAKLLERKSWTEAIELFRRLAAQYPQSALVHNYGARAWEGLERLDQALVCIDAALSINPNDTADLRNRAVILRKVGRPHDALRSLEEALALKPDDRELLLKRATSLNELDRREEALDTVDRAKALYPRDIETLNARAIILDNLQCYGEALRDVEKILQLQPNHLDGLNNSGMLMARMGHFDQALNFYNRSLHIQPNQEQARYNRSLIRLSLGDWTLGLEEFEVRWDAPPLKGTSLKSSAPLWLGREDLKGKTLLVYHEQGYGDTLQCARFIPLLIARGINVILAVPSALKTLMKSLPSKPQILTERDVLPPHDAHCPLMSLMWVFRITPKAIPNGVPYLGADPSKVQYWGRKLPKPDRFRIGLVWSGRRYAPINYPRDVRFEMLDPLWTLDADFICLQKDFTTEDELRMRKVERLRNIGADLVDFADTAAVIENLDLLISADTATAHLAGAMGKPIWLMNRFASCWRWLQSGSESAWYPTLRQFRQPAVGDWASVITSLTREVGCLIASARQTQVVRLSDPAASASSVPDATLESPEASRAPRPSCQSTAKIRLVCATRGSAEEFFAKAPLGRSLPHYREFPRSQVIELRLFKNNTQGLSATYNVAIEEAKSDPAILVFIHDDVYLSDFYWAVRIQEAIKTFDIVGLVGNRRRLPRQASWMFLDETFKADADENLSGVLGHGDPFPSLTQLSVYGDVQQEVKLLDGVLLAARSDTLINKGLHFDPQFLFHFYDLDFCRQAELRGLRMGTWALSVVHASAGRLGGPEWRRAYDQYLRKYAEF